MILIEIVIKSHTSKEQNALDKLSSSTPSLCHLQKEHYFNL